MGKPSISSLFIMLFLIILLINIPSSHSSNHTDFEALLAFKKSIHDDPLGALSTWNETIHFCRWNGIWCSKRHPNRVVSVSLQSKGLVGFLSPHIGNLSFLRNINLQNNSFHGPIPQEIGRLRRLRVVEFSNNSLGGLIPRNLSQCSNLYYLNIRGNQLNGSIVPEIGSLVNLQKLGLTYNMLSGAIPPSLGNLTNLTELLLRNCGLQGEIPESLVQLGKMQLLILSENSLTGRIPSSLYNLSRLIELRLGSNQFYGTIPSFTLPKLRVLDLGLNHFSGVLPVSVSNSSLIEGLRVSSNNFTGSMIDLTRLSVLKILDASSNHLNEDISTVISSLTNCTRLRVLQLADNLFTGSLPDSIGNLSSHLYGLVITKNKFTGGIPSSIGNLVGLSVLLAERSNLEGPIPSSIGKLHNLQLLSLGQNRLTGEIPLSFGNLTLLNNLILVRNNLSGSIPRSLGNCSNLLNLVLARNTFIGSIPPEIMRLSSISILLDLSHNVLMGTIPSEVGALINLGYLDLSNNRLSGNLPTSLSSCVMLELLALDRNSLQGEIPESLRTLRGLEYLDLSHNNFSGTIPRFLVELRLMYLNLSYNTLQGEVPTLGAFQNESLISLQGNPNLCGGIAILNLPSCSSPSSNKRDLLGKIMIPVAGAICLILLVCSYFCVIAYRRRTLQNAGTHLVEMYEVLEFLRLSYADLLKATGGFLESNLLGAGRFGSVYKGTIMNDVDNEERIVAVKVLNLNVRGAFKSLLSECNALRGIRHRNILKILSVCDSIDFQGNDFKALVYEFMANGSLENWLHEQGRGLSTIQRLEIAMDIAYAVEYLHFGTDSTIIHGDLKPGNILLDQNMVAHVGDFGLSKSISPNLSSSSGESSSSTAAIRGTIGYMAPEYGMNDVVTMQGDAYSYGILLLEMFTKRRPTMSTDAFEGYLNLRDFVSNALPNHVTEVVDPFLHQQLIEGDNYWDCVVSILNIGVRCSMEVPRDRMSMAQVVSELKKIKSVFVLDMQNHVGVFQTL